MARRGERPPIGVSWIVTWPLSAAFAALVFLSVHEASEPAHDVAPPVPVDPNWGAHLPERISALDAALRKAPLRLPPPIEEERGAGKLRWKHRLYELEIKRAQAPEAEATIESVRGVDPGLGISAENTADATEVRLGLDGLLVSTVRFLWREQPRARPRVAIVIGPLGDDLRVARQVIDVDGPLALGVRPLRPFSQQVAELGRMFDREVVLQLEAAPPPPTPAPDETPVSAPDPNRKLLQGIASLPDAVGVSCCGGANKAPKSVLAEVDRRKWLFIGDRGGKPTPGSLPAPAVLVEGDDEHAEALAAQLGALAERARRDGRALAVGRPTDATLAGLRQAMVDWRAGGIDVVPVTALVTTDGLSPP